MSFALVTGASSGIGAATVTALRAKGWDVLAIARREDELARLAAATGAEVRALSAADADAIDALARDLGARCPDVIVHCAGAGRWLRIEDTTPAEARAMMDAPFFADFLVTRAFLPAMLARRSGQIIHVNSPAAYVPWPFAGVYAATRAAVRGLHDALRQDLHGTGVRSCHITFGKVTSGYWEANPGALEKMPRIEQTFPSYTPERCAEAIMQLIARPRAEVILPHMMAFYLLCWRIWPGLVRTIVRLTSPRV